MGRNRVSEYPGTCPECATSLIECTGEDGGTVYDAVKCPNGCKLWVHYA